MESSAFNGEIGNKNKMRVLQSLPAEPEHKDSYKTITLLNYNDSQRFNLIDLNKLDEKSYRDVYKNISQLEFDNNSIKILKLKSYQMLERVSGRNNSITSVEMSLSKLKYLDLSNNMLTKIFELNSLPLLEELILNDNSITEIVYENLRCVKKHLRNLELARNRIEFKTPNNFFALFRSIGSELKELQRLNIINNSFNNAQNKIYKENYAKYIVCRCENLKYLNVINIESFDRDLNANELEQIILKAAKEQGSGIRSDEGMTVALDVRLADIIKECESFSQKGRLNNTSLKEFEKKIQIYLNNTKSEEDDDSTNIDDPELDEFETFLEYCNIMIDSNPTLSDKLIAPVTKFVTIKNGKFAGRALGFILNRLNPETSNSITEMMNNNIFEYIRDDIPQNIVLALCPFLEYKEFNNPLNDLLRKMLKILISKRQSDLLLTKNSNSEEIRKTREIYYSTLTFVASAARVEEHLKIIIENRDALNVLNVKIKEVLEKEKILFEDIKAMEILNKLLEIVTEICCNGGKDPKYSDNINKLVTSGIRDKIEKSIENSIPDILRTSYNNLSSKNISNFKRMTFACLVRCYGAVLFQTKEIEKIFEKVSTNTYFKIFNFLVQTEIYDPLIISASCDFTLCLLKNTGILSNKCNSFKNITDCLHNLKYLLPYLSEKENQYINACLVAAEYGENTIIRGMPIETNKMNSDLIFNLVISIANLIEFYGNKCKRPSNIQEICKKVCEELNSQNRDTLLCNLLSMSSEKVKLAIVEALYGADVSQLDSNEIYPIWGQIKNMNLSEGVTEKIISIIIIILNKWFVNILKEDKVSDFEKNKDAIILVLDLLFKNEERIYKYKGDTEGGLSFLSCIFLHNCSVFVNKHKFLPMKEIFLSENIREKIVKILYMQQKMNNVPPIEAEKIRSGCDLKIITEFLEKDICLRPFNLVSLRILIHFSDLLMGFSYPLYNIEYDADFSDVFKSLKSQIIDREIERVDKKESQSFREFENDRKNVKNDLFQTLTEKETEILQLDFIKNFNNLLKYVNCLSNPIEMAELRTQLEHKFDNYLIKKDNFSNKYDKQKDIFYEKVPDENADIYEKFVMYLRDEQYCQQSSMKENLTDHADIKNDYLVFLPYISEKYPDKIKRYTNEENLDNPYLRSKFIAAFLRSIYALLEFPMSIEIKNKMISVLYQDDNIYELSKLVDCTKLIHDNISSKYLIIMRHVITNSSICFENRLQDYKGILFILKITSYMISKIVRVFKKKLNLEDNDHKILLSEVSKSYSIIINELEYMNLSDEQKEEALNSMVGIDVMMVFIDIIKKQMNHEAESFKERAKQDKENFSKSDAIINEMIANISYIIGEYMSKCKKHSYRILESFTKSYVFEGVKMRKTYLREIINYSKDSDCKSMISSQYKLRVDFIIKVQVRDFLTSKTKICLLAVTNNNIEFYKIKNASEDFSYWGQNSFEADEELSVPINEIQKIITFDILDRIFIKSQNKTLFLTFNQNNISSLLVPLLKLKNPNIDLFSNIRTIVLEDQEKSSHTPTSTGESPGTENSHDESKPLTIIVCKSVIKGFFDFFKKIFSNKNSHNTRKVLVIYEKHLYMYEENYSQWNILDSKTIFTTNWGDSWNLTESTKLFPECYSLLKSYDLTGLTKFTTKGVDTAELIFTKDDILTLTLLDDLSYVKLKNGLFPFLKSKFEVNDNFHDNIK